MTGDELLSAFPKSIGGTRDSDDTDEEETGRAVVRNENKAFRALQVEEVDRLIAEGMSKPDACRKADMPSGVYFYWKSAFSDPDFKDRKNARAVVLAKRRKQRAALGKPPVKYKPRRMKSPKPTPLLAHFEEAPEPSPTPRRKSDADPADGVVVVVLKGNEAKIRNLLKDVL